MTRNHLNKKLIFLALICIFSLNPLMAYGQHDWRDPFDLDEVVGIAHFTRLILPVSALTAALLLTEPQENVDNAVGTMRQGSWFIDGRAGYYQGYHEHRTDIFEGASGFGYFLRSWLAVGMEFHATRFRDDRLGTSAVGGRPFVRWQLNKKCWSFYFEQGLGMIFSKENFPPGGTKINFTPAYGIGVIYHFLDKVHFVISARHYHLSNGGLIKGSDRNPGFDGNGLYAGYQIQF